MTPEPYRLETIDGRLTLVQSDRDAPVVVDFLSGATAHRAKAIRRKDHPLARAVGRKQPLPDILDATAGLGRDAFVLATLGYRVTAVERADLVFRLLADGHARLLADPRGHELVGDRFRIAAGDAQELLTTGEMRPDVVYLDPMFPERKKRASVKKEMDLFQRLLGPDPDTAELLAAARAAARDRVVIKRPSWSAPIAADVSHAVVGSKVRWDVYLS